VLELAGVRASGEIDGISQAKLLESGRPSSGTRRFFWHIPHYTNQGSRPSGAMREGTWKLVERYDDGKVELFDLSGDVGETRDLAAADPGRAASMRARLRQWRQSTGAQENTPNPAFDPEMFTRIYADFDSSRFEPLRADEAAWNAVALWRQRMNVATRRPPQ